MRLFGREVEGIPQLLVVFALVLLVATGLCGMQWAVQQQVPGGMIGALFLGAGIVELLAMVISAFAILTLLLIWPLQILTNRRRRSDGQVLGLFDKEKDRNDG